MSRSVRGVPGGLQVSSRSPSSSAGFTAVVRAQGGRDADPDRSGAAAADLVDPLDGGGHEQQHLPGIADQRFARWRQPHRVGGSLHQFGAELVLELADHLRHRLLGHEEFRRRTGEVQFVGHRHQYPKLPQFRHRNPVVVTSSLIVVSVRSGRLAHFVKTGRSIPQRKKAELTMAFYSLTEVKVLDGEGAQKYAEIAQSSVAAHGGKFLVLAAEGEVAEGEWPQDQLAVIIEFADKKQLHTWYDSAEYAPARKIAATALDRRLVFLEGFPPVAATDPETLVRRFYAAMNTGDVRAASDYLADDWQDIPLPAGTPAGIDGYRGTVAFLRSAFPDLDVRIEDVVVSGDRVAVRVLATGTHRGEILGVAPTGRAVVFRAFDFHHIKDGRIGSTWHLEDFFALQSQLGAQ